MGHKVNPYGFRLGISTKWTSNWYANGRQYAANLGKDLAVREFLFKKLANASISRVFIERPARSARVTIHTARPGIVIGKRGEDIERLKAEVAAKMALDVKAVHVSVEEIRKPELDSRLVAESIAQQLEKRIMFRRAMKRAVQNAMRQGAQGIKVQVSGRLNGAEIARTEMYREGRVPLHTLRAHIDYATAEALTTYGIIGVKVWVFTGEIFDAETHAPAERGERAPRIVTPAATPVSAPAAALAPESV